MQLIKYNKQQFNQKNDKFNLIVTGFFNKVQMEVIHGLQRTSQGKESKNIIC